MVDSVEYRRAATALHRVGSDRVFVHVLHRSAVPVELVGVTAAAWLALDEPARHAELVERLHAADVADFIIAMRVNGVHGLVVEACRAGALQGPGLEARAAEAHHGVLLTCLAAEAAAVGAADALAAVGVAMVALKGLANAHLDYPSPEGRVFGDADILVPSAGYERALGALAGAGFQRRLPPVRRGWERRFGRTVTHHGPNQAELDVHLRIAGGYFGFLIDHGGLWARATDSFTLAGRRIRALDRVRYLAGLAFPTRASLAARGRTRTEHLRRQTTALIGAGQLALHSRSASTASRTSQ